MRDSKVGVAVCIDGAGSVCWAVDCCCWSAGAWLAIFGVGVAVWVLTMVQVNGLGVLVAVVGTVVDDTGIIGADGGPCTADMATVAGGVMVVAQFWGVKQGEWKSVLLFMRSWERERGVHAGNQLHRGC